MKTFEVHNYISCVHSEIVLELVYGCDELVYALCVVEKLYVAHGTHGDTSLGRVGYFG